MTDEDKLKKYPKTNKFQVIDTIGVPHPYCITSRHVAFASDNHCGTLGKDAIIEGEKRGIVCGICKGDLSFDEHETILLVEVDSKKELKDVEGLKEYLLKIKPICEADGYVGFAFNFR